jgi:hypothetical protein
MSATIQLSQVDQQIVDRLAQSIAVHWLNGTRGDDAFDNSDTTNNNNNNNLQRLSSEMILQTKDEIRRRRWSIMDDNSDTISTTSDDVIFQMAYEKSTLHHHHRDCIVHPMSSKENMHGNINTNQSVGNSVSLFLPMSASVGAITALDNFITFEMIQERAHDSHDILQMLLKIQYIDDLIPDWDDVIIFLQKELSVLQSPLEATTVLPCTRTAYLRDILALHRQWFSRTRKGMQSSQDYRTIQISLLKNLIHPIQSWNYNQLPIESHNSGCDLVVLYESCIGTCLDMYCDWMDRRVDNPRTDPLIQQIGTTLWDFCCCMAPPPTQSLTMMFRRHCPYGQWVLPWLTQYCTVDEIVSLLARPIANINPYNGNNSTAVEWDGSTTTTLYFLYNEACVGMKNLVAMMNIATTNEFTTESWDTITSVVWIVSTFRSILRATRGSRFPWHLWCTSSGVDVATATNDVLVQQQHEQQHLQLFRLFVQVLQWLQDVFIPLLIVPPTSNQESVDKTSITTGSLDVDSVRIICLDSIEVMLCGVVLESTKTSMISDIQVKLLSPTIPKNDVYETTLHAMVRHMLDRVEF